LALIHEVLGELFGEGITENDVREAFTLDHPAYTSHAMVQEHQRGVLVHGDFNTAAVQCAHAGSFVRWLYRTGGSLVAEHRRIEVLEPYRRQKIARNHVSKALAFYESVGIEYVHLQAVDYGPGVWPQLGFEIHESWIRELVRGKFRSIVEEMGYDVDPPERMARLATAPAIDGVAPGILALNRTYVEDLNCQPIVMILDLQDEHTRRYLDERGILAT
jgi:GNAT superfamily N-acetyltransferase